ncbi:MAG TPA: Gfo/Idh/MocA family oxidoreductase [Chthonomonadales bacterium]|nr:Gfo/Idh/MocA family oxidoreductase [Chthonomonadales bacterium]
MSRSITRRCFLQSTAVGMAGFWLAAEASKARATSPNEKLDIGIIGVANRGADNLRGVSSQNIVALCDVDENYLSAAAQNYPSAKTYHDFRKLLEQKGLDAVVISTPDHTHAPATILALQAGLHVYCEKPLTHSVYEARVVAELAKKHRCITQMGTQIHAGSNYRRVVELVKSGAIGKVAEVHVWVSGGYAGGDRPADTPPVPPHLHWDLWLGPAPVRPYHPAYVPFHWRGWWDFGNGTLGDMACHHMDLPYWALDLRHPLTIESEGPPVHPESCPPWLIVRYQYPARGEQPPISLTWYNGDKRPPYFAEGKLPSDWSAGTLFIGEKGMLLADYNRHMLLPEKEFVGFEPPKPFIPESIGHYNEWIEACKTGGTTTCNFDYSGALTEAVLLGNVAYRTGQKLEWDAQNLKATNCPEADRLLRREWRKGWGM